MAYKLDGVDKDWVYLSYDKNSAFYNQLKKGTYSFWLNGNMDKENGRKAKLYWLLSRLRLFMKLGWHIWFTLF